MDTILLPQDNNDCHVLTWVRSEDNLGMWRFFNLKRVRLFSYILHEFLVFFCVREISKFLTKIKIYAEMKFKTLIADIFIENDD